MSSLQDIAQTLHDEAANDGTVTIDDSLLDSGDAFSQLVVSSLLRSQGNIILQANASDIPTNPTGVSFSFPAFLPTDVGDSFLNLTENRTTAVVSVIDSTSQFALQIELTQGQNGPIDWIFSHSFPEFIGWPLDFLPLSGPRFAFVFAPVEVPTGFVQGLNFSSNISLTGLFGPVEQFLEATGSTDDLGLLSGAVTQVYQDGLLLGPTLLWRASLGVSSVDIIVATITDLYVGASLAYLRPEGSEAPFTAQVGVFMGANVVVDNEFGTPIALQMLAEMPLTDSTSELGFMIVPQDPMVTNFANLGSLMGGNTWNQFIDNPPGNMLQPFLENFGLLAYQANLSLNPFFVTSSILIGGATEMPWVINPGQLQMNFFRTTWAVFDPFGTAANTLSLAGQLEMFGEADVLFDGDIILPEVALSLGLSSNPGFTAGQWLDTIVQSFGGPPIPDAVMNAMSFFSLSQVLFSMDVSRSLVEYTMVGSIRVGDNPIGFNVRMFGQLLEGSFKYEIKADLFIGYATVTGEIQGKDGRSVFAATWSDEINPLGFNSIAASLGYDDLGLPPDLDLALTQFGLAYDFTTTNLAMGGTSANFGSADLLVFKPEGGDSFALFFGVNIGTTIDLANLPLVGQALSPLQTAEIAVLSVLITSTTLTEEQAAQLNSLIELIDQQGGDLPQIPAQGMASTVNLSMNVNLGGYIIPLGQGVGGASATGDSPQNSSVQGTPSGNTAAPVPSTPGSDSAGTTWFNVQKAFGPVTFHRIGVTFDDGVLWFLLDATMKASALAVDLIGLSVGSPLSDFDPRFQLSGLGVAFKSGGMDIAGGFMKVDPPSAGAVWEYGGGAVIQAFGWSITALGDYASLDGTPSMFIFGQVTGAFGGPPAFFITGLAAGFGYNSSLRTPDVTQIFQFPLVAGVDNPDVLGGADATPLQALAVLLEGPAGGAPWVSHQIGQNWLAVGIQFTSFELVTTNALLVVDFGRRMEIALLGIAKAKFPMDGSETYAQVELQLETLYDPAVGVFLVAAELSPNSYLLDPACALAGGFAFYTWLAPSPHAGDFVISLGGYHPDFQPPPWYPTPSKVSFTWSLDNAVSITGGSYFAMTPSAAMAGGNLNVTYKRGDLKAWFKAWANILLFWNPFQFNIDVGVSVGASYRLNLGFTTKTLTAELGANLVLWGPPTGGKVTVHWWIIDFTISFGNSNELQDPDPIDWTGFQSQLPQTTDIVKFMPGEGLAPTGSANPLEPPTWSVRPTLFRFSTDSAIPCSQLQLGSSGNGFENGAAVNIRPMQQTDLTSTHKLVLKRDGVEFDPQQEGWTVSARKKNLPKAMWGTGPQNQIDPGDDQLVTDQLTGFTVRAPDPTRGDTPGEIDVAANLQFTNLASGTLPVQPDQSPQGDIAQLSDKTIEDIGSGIMATQTVNNRNALYNSLMNLGVDPGANGSLSTFARQADNLFTEEPLLIPAS